LAIIGLGLGMLIPHLKAQSFSSSHRLKTRIPFNYERDLIIIPLWINQKGPYHFIFDSGVSISLITNSDLEEKLSLVPQNKIEIKGFGVGENIQADLVHHLQFKLGNQEGSGFTAAILPKGVLDFSNYVGLPIDGIIGYDILKYFRVDIDYSLGRLLLDRSPEKKTPEKGFIPINIQIEGGKALIPVQLIQEGGKPLSINLVFDTGAGNSLFLDQSSNPQLIPPLKFLNANLGWGINGSIVGKIGRVDKIIFAGIEMNHIIAAYPLIPDSLKEYSHHNFNGNLGNEILKRFHLIIDYPAGKIYLKKRFNFSNSFEYDMSGIGFTAEGKDFRHFFVSSIDPNSPGELAGLKPGDLILFVNDNPSSDYTMSELDRLFQSGEGRRINILYFRDGTIQECILTLKRRI